LEKVPKLPIETKLIEGYVDYLTPKEKTVLDEIGKDALILVSYKEIVDFLKDLSLTGNLLKDSVAVMSEPEPEREEASGYEVVSIWLSKMGVQHYRVRASGHYYPYQLETILNTVKPKKKIGIIHTEAPELFHALIDRAMSAISQRRTRKAKK
jgi:ribonuclease J